MYNKCYYVVATKNNTHYYTEGEFTQQEIDNLVNNFNIDDFINDADEEFTGPAEGTYAVIRQNTVSTQEALDIGYVTKHDNSDGTYTCTWGHNVSDAITAAYDLAKQRIEAEVLAEYGDVEVPYVCQKSFV
jgi:hypothetical protein